MPKKLTRSKIVKKLDAVFSQYIRLSNTDTDAIYILKDISKDLSKGDKQLSIFNTYLKEERIKEAVDILKMNNLIK